MRQLTASQKIAILENRVAQLEKQAMLEELKAKIFEKLEVFSRWKTKIKEVFKKQGNPKDFAKDFQRYSKTREYEEAMKELRSQVGNNPIKQISFLFEAQDHPEIVLDNPLFKKASHSKRGGLAFFLLNPELGLIAFLILGSIVTYILHAVGIKRFASIDKEGGFLGGVVVWTVLFFFFSFTVSMYQEAFKGQKFKSRGK